MKLTRTFLLAVVTLVVTMAGSAAAQSFTSANIENVKIKNFGQMDERFYRGGQPKEDQYKQLADLGIKTVIDLQEEPTDYEKAAVEALGMRYVNIPMREKTYPKAEHVAEFMKLVSDPSTGKFYVHCAGGRHRTGAMGAVYRFNNYNWNFDQVYKEMKDFDFYTRWGHGDYKDFVKDYAASLLQKTSGAAQSQAGVKQ
jgi:protein tyrosine/serine phosphatase